MSIKIIIAETTKVVNICEVTGSVVLTVQAGTSSAGGIGKTVLSRPLTLAELRAYLPRRGN